VKWRKGGVLTADQVIWNIKSVLDPKTGSSVLGLMKGYMTVDVPTDEKDAAGKPKMSSQLWDANAIEKVDDFTVRLNLRVPQLAVPEHFFHYPFFIADPAEGGKLGVGMNGTGPFEMVEYEISKRAVLKARKDYWGKGPYLDEVIFVDLGDDPAAEVAAMASKQVHSIVATNPSQLPILKRLPDLQFYSVGTGATVHARAYPVKPFDDNRILKAMRHATDNDKVAEITFGDIGSAPSITTSHRCIRNTRRCRRSSTTRNWRRRSWPRRVTRTGSRSRFRSPSPTTGPRTSPP